MTGRVRRETLCADAHSPSHSSPHMFIDERTKMMTADGMTRMIGTNTSPKTTGTDRRTRMTGWME
ncbi:Hypothetical protein MVR_LOCUS201 [uncultured virus]|nr:Hypothetical protein MVR_LOCUS201 [uncultured virus]